MVHRTWFHPALAAQHARCPASRRSSFVYGTDARKNRFRRKPRTTPSRFLTIGTWDDYSEADIAHHARAADNKNISRLPRSKEAHGIHEDPQISYAADFFRLTSPSAFQTARECVRLYQPPAQNGRPKPPSLRSAQRPRPSIMNYPLRERRPSTPTPPSAITNSGRLAGKGTGVMSTLLRPII